jgi:hypothetical protein
LILDSSFDPATLDDDKMVMRYHVGQEMADVHRPAVPRSVTFR